MTRANSRRVRRHRNTLPHTKRNTRLGVEPLEPRALLAALADLPIGPLDLPTPDQSTNLAVDAATLTRIVNGTTTTGFPSVGLVGDTSGNFCSGTLITSRYVLTAAHCAEGVGNTQGRFTVGGTTYATSRVIVHPNYTPARLGEDGANDIALFELNRDATGITPSPIFRGTPVVGQTLTLVGFGAGGTPSGGHNGDFGTKRVGTTPIDGVSATLITWNFDSVTEANTAPGDSGGPAFVQVGGVYQVAGVTSGGDRNDAGLGDHSFDTRVDAYAAWIDSFTGGGGGGGGGGTTDDHANAPGTAATPLNVSLGPVSVTGTHEQAGDRDVFSVTLDTAGTLDIDLTTLAGGDMYLRLYGSTGQLVAENDDSGGTLNSALTRSVAAGTYYISAGTYQDQGVGGYRLDVAFQVAPPAQSFSFSTAVAGTLTSSDGARLSADDSDIVQAALAADGRVTYTLAFDGSDVGLTTDAEDLDAFAVLADGSLIVSTVGAASVPGPNGTTLSAAAEDLLQFRPTALGDNTAGTWSLYFDGSDVGLTLASENIDAVSVLSDGRLVISTTGSVAVTGVSSGVKEDLLAFRPTTLGANTAGTWAMYFDGSDVGLSGTSENVDAANVASDGTIHLSTNGPFSVPGLSGRASDVFAFRPTSTGDQTAGTYPSTFTFPGAQLGLTSLNIDGFHVGRLPSPAGPGATSGYQLVVRFTDSNVTASQRQIFQQAADRWSQIIVGDVPNVVVDGLAVDDVVIDASAPQIDGEGGILGQAGPTYFRPTTYLPSRGVMEFDAADLASLEADGSLLWVVLHEMGHVLGIGTIWENLGLVRTTATGMDYVGTHAVAAYNQLFGTTGTVVPVETDGGSGTAGGHWDEASFDNELMTGYLNGNRANPLSRITVGTLQDMGYQVNYAAADAYTPPARKRVVARGGDAHGLPAALVAADPQPALSAAPGPVARNVDHVFAWYASSRDAWSRADAPLDRFVVPASAVNPARSPAWSRPALPTRALPTAAEATDPAWLDLDPLLAELVGEIQGAV